MLRLKKKPDELLTKVPANDWWIQQRFSQCRDIFAVLVEFAQELNIEHKRAISENWAEEELASFDRLTKPDITLTEKEKQKIKQVAKELLLTLQQ